MDLSELNARLTRIEDLEAIKQFEGPVLRDLRRRPQPGSDHHDLHRGRDLGRTRHRHGRRPCGDPRVVRTFSADDDVLAAHDHEPAHHRGRRYRAGDLVFSSVRSRSRRTTRPNGRRRAITKTMRKVDGTWKIKHLRIKPPVMVADYETSWAKQKAAKA